MSNNSRTSTTTRASRNNLRDAIDQLTVLHEHAESIDGLTEKSVENTIHNLENDLEENVSGLYDREIEPPTDPEEQLEYYKNLELDVDEEIIEEAKAVLSLAIDQRGPLHFQLAAHQIAGGTALTRDDAKAFLGNHAELSIDDVGEILVNTK